MTQINMDRKYDKNYPEPVEQVYEFIIPAKKKADRLDTFVTNSIDHATRTRVQKAIDSGAITVNGNTTKANYKIRPGDTVRVVVMKPPPLMLVPEDIPLEVLFEDEHLIVVNKPAGMPSHPGIGNRYGTLVNAILWHNGQREPISVLGRRESMEDDEVLGDEDENEEEVVEDSIDELDGNSTSAFSSPALRPGIVHRLDKDTAGVMVVGKTYAATLHLSQQFAARTVAREYVALAWGVIHDDTLLIETQFGRSTRDRKLHAVMTHGGKYAATEVTIVERYSCATLITCKLRTGRTHQIRVHLAHKKHPLVGDKDYGGREAALTSIHHLFRRQAQLSLPLINRQALHARSLAFIHPITKQEMAFTSAVPSDFVDVLNALRSPEVTPLPQCLH